MKGDESIPNGLGVFILQAGEFEARPWSKSNGLASQTHLNLLKKPTREQHVPIVQCRNISDVPMVMCRIRECSEMVNCWNLLD